MSKNILLLDGIGAVVSAVLLLFIPYFEPYLGIPRSLTQALLPILILCAIFSFLSYTFGNKNWRLLLKIIAISNLLYCFLMVYVTYSNRVIFKNMGMVYFMLEILLIFILAIFELRIAVKRGE